MGTKWTTEQQQVIDLRDCNMLVSAAAGSGKTAVLVERILSRIMDEKKPVDIDRLLVVTFTNAAAAEMRERIRLALEKALEEHPDNVHLQRQMTLVHHAQITTIHSFCLEVIRNHFHTIGLDPGFRIGDEGELKLLRHDVMEKLLEEEYRKKDPDFLRFSESFAPGKSDEGLEQVIQQLYDFSMGYPWPGEWLEECGKDYEAETVEELCHKPWMRLLFEKIRLQIQDHEDQIRMALNVAEEEDGPYLYIDALEDDLTKLTVLKRCGDYREYASALSEMGSWTVLSRKKMSGVSEQKKALVKDIRDHVKKDIKRLQEDYFFAAPEQMLEDMRQMSSLAGVLVQLAGKFEGAYSRQKAEKTMVDFNDLEHLALQILVRKEGNRMVGTAVAAEYADYFDEIMIDEYQDSNLVQELLLSSVSKREQGGHNVFMVGDVKQSIYRFRLARPELFMGKYHTYTKGNGVNRRIDLHKNFRSRNQVLEGVNLIFRQIMRESLGGIEYDEEAALYPGATFAEGGSETFQIPEMVLISDEAKNGENEQGRDAAEKTSFDAGEENIPLDVRQREAVAAAHRIQEIVGHEMVWDKHLDAYRPARYSDIVLLLRTVAGWADTFAEVFGDMGIPTYTGGSCGYFSTLEVRTILSYLRVLDNPMQDIPLASALRSPIGGLTDEQLAKLRIQSPQTNFYTCCAEYLRRPEQERDPELSDKLEHFWKQMEALRTLVPYTPMHILLWKILDVTGYLEYASAMPGGAQRKANLEMLVEKAVSYEATSYRGLFHFVRYIEHLQKYEIDYGEASLGSETSDTVRILSIHKSKGLEFPIVLVCGMGKHFNQQDARGSLVLHPEFGLGCDYVDPERRIRRPLLLKKVIGRQIAEENLGEELRVLYVAMTRAKEKLILMGSVKELEDQLVKWSGRSRQRGEKLSYSCLVGAASYLDWVMPALLRHRCARDLLSKLELPLPSECETAELPGDYRIRIWSGEDVRQRELSHQRKLEEMEEQLRRREPQKIYDANLRERLDNMVSQHDPCDINRRIPGKLTVSELKKMGNAGAEEDSALLFEQPLIIPLLPRFRKEEEAPGGTARGTVYHSFMENLEFTGDFAGKFAQTQLETMIKCGKIFKDEAKWISMDKINRFLSSDLAARMQRAAWAGMLFRERPFVLGVKADEIREDWDAEEEILVQGIIDAYFYENDEIILMDYKTDYVEEGRGELLAERYGAQLEYYKLALERLTGKQVREKLIYSFCLNQVIPVDIRGKS